MTTQYFLLSIYKFINLLGSYKLQVLVWASVKHTRMAGLCRASHIILFCREYFKIRSEHLEDKILIVKFELVQLKGRVQNDGSNCGVYCIDWGM